MPKSTDRHFFKIPVYIGVLFLIFFGIGYFAGLIFLRPLISVIIPTYNRADLLPRAVESILNQSFKNFELIIVDDASTDETVDLLKTYVKKDKRVKVIKSAQNGGVSDARNKGLSVARGEFVAFLDSDDYAFLDMLQRQLTVMRAHPRLAAVTGNCFPVKDGATAPPLPARQNNGLLFDMNPADVRLNHLFTSTLSHSGAFVRRSFLARHGIWYDEDLRSAEDYDFFKQILLNQGAIARVREIWTVNRAHQSHDKRYYKTMRLNSGWVKRQFYAPYFTPSPHESDYHSMGPGERCKMVKKLLDNFKQGGWLYKSDLTDFLGKWCQ